MESPHRSDDTTPPPPDHGHGEVGQSSARTPPPSGEGERRGWTQAEIDAEIEQLGDVPLYDPGDSGEPADDLEATAVHRPFDVDATSAASAPATPLGEGTTAAERLVAYEWLFGSQRRPAGPRPPLWRQDDTSPGSDGPPTAPIAPVGVRRTHPVASAVPQPTVATASVLAQPRPRRAASVRSADRRRQRGGKIALVMLVMAICLSLGSAAAMVGFRLSQNGTSLAGLMGNDASATPSSDDDGGPQPGRVWDGALEPVTGVTATAQCVDPPGDDEGTPVPYEPQNLLDDDPATAWRCTGGTPTVTFEIPADARIAEIGLVNGYAKDVDGLDRYPLYQRALLVRWTFADGTSVTQELTDDTRTAQTMRIPVRTGGTVTLEILKITSPSVQSATRDSLALSDVVFFAPVR